MTTRPWLPVAAALTTLVLWASAFVGIRHLGGVLGPGPLSLARLSVMLLTLLVLLRGRPGRVPSRQEWPVLLVGGAAWFGVYNLALNEAERRIDAATAALVVQVGPILVGLLAASLLGERLSRWLLGGMAIGFGGVALIAYSSSGEGHRDTVGVLLAVVAAATFAIGVLTQKKLLSGLRALELTFWYALVGWLVCLPWAGATVREFSDASTDTWVWVVYLGVFPSAIAFVCWAYALSHADAGPFSQSTFLVPFITAVMAWALLDEVPAPLVFVGGALCIVGVLVARRTPRAAAEPEPEPVDEQRPSSPVDR